MTATNSQLSKFVTNKAKCLAHKCGVPLNEKEGETTVCKHHKAEEPEICVQTIYKVNDMQEHFSRLWTQCQRCQGTTFAKVLSGVALYSMFAFYSDFSRISQARCIKRCSAPQRTVPYFTAAERPTKISSKPKKLSSGFPPAGSGGT